MDKISQMTLSNLKSVYLVTGERYFQKQFGNKIKQLLLKTDLDSSSYEKLDGREYELPHVLEKAESLPFFSERRLVFVENASYFSDQLSDRDKQMLINYLENPCPTTVLVFFTDKVDKRQKLIKSMQKKDMLVEFTQLKPWETDKWIKEQLSAKGKKIDSSALSLLVQRVGNELPLLEQELEKLDLYTGENTRISEDDVANAVTELAETNVFKLVDKIGEKKPAEAIGLVRELTLKEPPVKILFLIARQFRLLIKMKALLKDGHAASEASKKLKVHPFVGKKLSAQCKNFSEFELRAAIKEIQSVDYSIKTGQLEGIFALERLLLSFI